MKRIRNMIKSLFLMVCQNKRIISIFHYVKTPGEITNLVKALFSKFFSWRTYGCQAVIVVSIALWIILLPRIFVNASNLISSLVTGKASVTEPLPLYGYLHMKTIDPLFKDHTFAADFAAVYFMAKNFDKDDVYTGRYDPEGRPAPYLPVVLFIYSKTFGNIPFGLAVIAHLGLQLVLLLFATFFILKYYKLRFLIFPITLVYAVIVFLSPVGLAWFERGQFDVFVALSLLFFFFGVYESKGYAFVVSALFASLKITMGLFFVQAFIIYLFIYPDKERWKFFVMFTKTFLLMLFVFPQHLAGFVDAACRMQSSFVCGLTLVNKIPDVLLVLIPAFCTLLFPAIFFFSSTKKESFRNVFFPYMTTLVGTNLLLLANNWEYRIISCLGLLPIMIVWCFKICTDRLYAYEVTAFFVLFLFMAFHLFWFIDQAVPGMEYFIAIYIAFYLGVTVVSVPRILLSGDFYKV